MKAMIALVLVPFAVMAQTRDQFGAWEWMTDRTTTPMTAEWTGDLLTALTVPGLQSFAALAEIRAVTPEQVAAWIAATAYPQPEDLCPMLDTNGNVVGSALWLVDAATMQGYATTNTASPRRAWAEQRAAFVAARDRKANADAKGKAGVNGSLQTRIENIERALGWRQ
jgi:hypothetical protein